jgi:iron complex outermembrane receptor protein
MTNNEASSKGHALANLYGYWLIREGVRLDFGVENLFDAYYLEHLAGYNRITGSDVALGSRVPGARRSGFARIRWAM